MHPLFSSKLSLLEDCNDENEYPKFSILSNEESVFQRQSSHQQYREISTVESVSDVKGLPFEDC